MTACPRVVLAAALELIAPAAALSAPMVFDTELLSLSLMGDTTMPLGRGMGPVQSHIDLTHSLTRVSRGRTTINSDGMVQSFFDVFFDITITDIDPTNDFFDGSSQHVFRGLTSRFQMSFLPPDPCTGAKCLLPPDGATLDVGGLPWTIKLPAVQLGDPTAIMFETGRATIQHTVGVTGSPSGNAFDWTFDMALDLAGHVNPPFSFTLTDSNVQVRFQETPAPATLALLGVGLLGLACTRRAARRSSERRALPTPEIPAAPRRVTRREPPLRASTCGYAISAPRIISTAAP